MSASGQSLVALSRLLRKQRLREERRGEPERGPAVRPDIYFDHAPSGTYPIIAFRTVPCDRYVKGRCLPCSYSARAYATGVGRDSLYASLETQLEWVLSHFDQLVVARADGHLQGYRLRRAPDRPWYMLQLAGESSFFRDAEVPAWYRRRLLERLVDFQNQRAVNLHVMLECRPEDLLAAHESGELGTLAPLLRDVDVVVNVGLEYRDDWLRNELFAKELDLVVFERAIAAAHQHRLDPGVFVFAGGPVLTASEILQETARTLRYLETLGVFVNLMVPNLQAHTVPERLWEVGVYELPEPYFLLDLAELALSYRPRRPNLVTPFDWFIGGIETDPPPRYTLLSQPRKATSQAVTEAVHETLLELVHGLDADRFHRRAARLRAHPDAASWRRQLAYRDSRSWPRRLEEALMHLDGELAPAGSSEIPVRFDVGA